MFTATDVLVLSGLAGLVFAFFGGAVGYLGGWERGWERGWHRGWNLRSKIEARIAEKENDEPDAVPDEADGHPDPLTRVGFTRHDE